MRSAGSLPLFSRTKVPYYILLSVRQRKNYKRIESEFERRLITDARINVG